MIYMMNNFAIQKLSANMLFHDSPMGKYTFTIFQKMNISLLVNSTTIAVMIFLSIVCNIAFFTTKMSFIIFNSIIILPKLNIAIKTFYRGCINNMLVFSVTSSFAKFSTIMITTKLITTVLANFNHISLQLNKVGTAVVHESRSSHSNPINRKNFGSFVNSYSIAY